MHRRTNSAFPADRWPPGRDGARRTGQAVASTAVSGLDESAFLTITLDPSVLAAGQNVIVKLDPVGQVCSAPPEFSS